MSEKKAEFDPFAPWKQMQGTWTDAWAKAMNETVASEHFAQSMGQYWERYLESSSLVRRQVEDAMETYLQQMNLPTGTAVTGLGERLTHLEMRMDDLDAKADDILDHLKAIQGTLTAGADPKSESQ